jgi:hypothetical protein
MLTLALFVCAGCASGDARERTGAIRLEAVGEARTMAGRRVHVSVNPAVLTYDVVVRVTASSSRPLRADDVDAWLFGRRGGLRLVDRRPFVRAESQPLAEETATFAFERRLRTCDLEILLVRVEEVYALFHVR